MHDGVLFLDELTEREFASATEPSMVGDLLRVREGMAPGYWWVECGSCNTGWQVAHYAESVVR